MDKKLLMLSLVSCTVTAFYCKRISKQMDVIIKQADNENKYTHVDDSEDTYVLVDCDGNVVDIDSDSDSDSDIERGFYF